MLFKVASLFLILSISKCCYSLSIKEISRQDANLDSVNFLFWSNSELGGDWVLDWSTWQWKYVTTRDEDPLPVRFDTGIDDTFNTLLQTENNDKFRPDAKTKVIIHGWTENGRIDWIRDMAHAYFDSDSSLNVISVEWSQLAAGPPEQEYSPAARNTQPVGQHVGEFINYMINRDETSFSLSDFHVVGFSLGAQVAGKAGSTLKSLNGDLGRITGLDPAENDFMGKPTSEQLDSNDAIFVDVMHTSANSQTQWDGGPIGNREQLGDMDFWPNSGNCPMPGTEWTMYPCGFSHMRATEYFVESISNPTGFRARKANSYADFTISGCDGAEQMMGEAASSTGESGNYYLDTNGHSPFAKGQTCFN